MNGEVGFIIFCIYLIIFVGVLLGWVLLLQRD